MVTTQTISTDSGAAQEDFNALKGNIPQVDFPSTVNTPGGNIIYNPGGKSSLKGERIAQQIRGFDLGKKVKRINKGRARVGGFNSAEAARAYAEQLSQTGQSQGSDAFQNVDYVIKKGPKGFQVVAKESNRPRSTEYTSPEYKDGQGNPINDPTGTQTSTVNKQNEFLQQILETLYPGIVQGEQARAQAYTDIQGNLQREAAGVGETSPEQEAQVQAALQASADRGNQLLDRNLGTNVRDVTSNLRKTGFASSNLADVNLNEGAYREYRDGTTQLARDLAQEEQNIRNNIATRQNQAVNTLAGVSNAEAPKVQQASQLQEGTFQKMPSLSEIVSLARLYNLDIPAKDQEAFANLLNTLISSQTTIARPSTFESIAGGIASGVGGAIGGAFL